RDVAEEPAAPKPEAKNEPITVAAEAPFATPRAESEAAPAPMAKARRDVEGGVEGRVAGGIVGGVIGDVVPSAHAADFVQAQAPHNELFGISVDAGAFAHVKDAIERGERPRAVNVEALINYFAGPPEHRSPREVGLEVEASPAPVTAGPRAFIIRTTIDTAHQDIPPGASPLPVATDARLEIELDGNAVLSHRRAGSGDELSGVESTLLKNASVTALYEVELKANLPWRQPIATVRLHYRSIANGKEKTITRIVHASDVARPWAEASRRHRLASLGAVWGETLKNAPGALREATKESDVARRAEELANQEPKDAKARELAMLATASSRLQSSAPTGSGR
ncbi:MAG TPA: von Willebrand factor type A domain-containing protein, partial [Thermoanaerobaculia bacterium]